MSEAILPVQATAPPRLSEDLVAVGLGLAVFLLALLSLAGADALGWLVTTSVWTDPSTALAPVSKAYAGLGGGGALLVTYVALLPRFCRPAASCLATMSDGSRSPSRRLRDRLCELVRRRLGALSPPSRRPIRPSSVSRGR